MFTKLKKSLQKSDSEQGFTIIEVMIVLAIAGLILLIVFLAVPALQRNSRNTQRKNDASHVASLISEYESNNSGTPPTGVTFSGVVAAGGIDATGEKFSILSNTGTLTTTVNAGTLPAAPAVDSIIVESKTTCNGNVPSTTIASTRSLVVYYYLEGATASGCIQT